MPDAPTFELIGLRCICGHRWNDWQPCAVPIRVWVVYGKTYRCPKCGNGPDRIFPDDWAPRPNA